MRHMFKAEFAALPSGTHSLCGESRSGGDGVDDGAPVGRTGPQAHQQHQTERRHQRQPDQGANVPSSVATTTNKKEKETVAEKSSPPPIKVELLVQYFS